MFRAPEYCDRYEYIPIQLDTSSTTPGAGVAQRKNGYQFIQYMTGLLTLIGSMPTLR